MAQVNIGTGFFNYTQTFGASGPSPTWTDNSSYLGWYYLSSNLTYGGYVNITAALPSNTGGLYTYQCNGGGDVKLGSRASGGTGTIRYGVRFRNVSGTAIQSINVAYEFFQLSLAQNGGNINTLTFEYQVSAGFTGLNSGAWISVPALDFSQLQNSAISGGSQINSFPCTQTGTRTAVCIPVTVPNGSDIVLRFTDVDDSGNDHHMAIDNFVVNTFTNNICSPLPIELLRFDAKKIENNQVQCDWKTASEKNTASFDLEASEDAVNFKTMRNVSAAGESFTEKNYSVILSEQEWQPNSYYRLKQWDKDLNFSYSQIVYINAKNEQPLAIYQLQNNTSETNDHFIMIEGNANQLYQLDLYNGIGQIVLSINALMADNKQEKVKLPQLPKGVYLASLKQGNQHVKAKLVID
jgi:hypothetical protein